MERAKTVYLLLCADGSYYTGRTADLNKRLGQHQRGEGARHTRSRLPVQLVWHERFSYVHDAYAREQQIKGWSRAKKAALAAGDIDRLKQLAKRRSVRLAALAHDDVD